MAHAKSLRVIGQSLEAAKLRTFQVETDGINYALRSNAMSAASEWIVRHAISPYGVPEQQGRQSPTDRSVCFTPTDISRLDQQGQKQRGIHAAPEAERYRRLSQLLRTLGDHIDRAEANTFKISWTPSFITVDFQSKDGHGESRTFTVEKLEQLGRHSRFRWSGTGRLDAGLPSSPQRLKPRGR
jgi:hypothetical protein